MADQQDVARLGAAAGIVALGLAVHLGHQRTGGVEVREAPAPASAGTDFGTPWAENTTGASLRHLGEVLDEDRPLALQLLDHVAVVHDLVTHVDRGAVAPQRLLDHPDRAVDAGAEAARARRAGHEAASCRACRPQHGDRDGGVTRCLPQVRGVH